MWRSKIALVVTIAWILACATREVVPMDAPSGAPPAVGPIDIAKSTFARGVDAAKRPVGAMDVGLYDRKDTIFLSLQLRGRPSGVLTSRWFWLDSEVAAAAIDLEEIERDEAVSAKEGTFVDFHFIPSDPLPVGVGYRVDVDYEGTLVGTWDFAIMPPPGAISSRLAGAMMAKGATDDFQPIEPTTIFAPSDGVHVVVKGDFGIGSAITATWIVADAPYVPCSLTVLLTENHPDSRHTFSCVPEGGWPPGDYEVQLTLDGRDAGTYSFSVAG